MTQDWLFDLGNTRLKCAPLWRGRQRRARARVRAVGARCVAVGRSRVPRQRRERRRARAIARCLVAPLPPHRHRAHGGDVRRSAHRLRRTRRSSASIVSSRWLGAHDAWPALIVGVGTALDDRPGRRRRPPPRRPHRAVADADARNAARPRDATRADGRHVCRIRRRHRRCARLRLRRRGARAHRTQPRGSARASSAHARACCCMAAAPIRCMRI